MTTVEQIQLLEDYWSAIDLLKEAKLQLEYLHEKFPATGTGEAVLSRLKAFLAEAGE